MVAGNLAFQTYIPVFQDMSRVY